MKMEQHKMEKDFSKKLSEREIQPSSMAWDRLDAMLAVAEEKKAVKKYNWIYIAAGFLGFLFIGMMLFTQTEEVTDSGKNDVVIENEAIKDSVKATPNLQEIKPVYKRKVQNASVALEENIKSKSAVTKIKSEPILVHKKQIINQNQNNQNNVIADNKSNPSQSIISPTDANGQKNQKTEQIKKTTYVNVDELLASVDESPKEKALKAKSSKAMLKVNPNSLLTQVDEELELSFRERAINTINKKFQSVKVALSNRNVQQ